MRVLGDLVLGYDFGTSSVKSALFDAEGRVVARAREAYPLAHPAPGWAEQDPEDWWRAMTRATRKMLEDAAIPPERIAALGIAAQMGGMVPLDEAGAPLHPALIWLDTRSARQARRLVAGWPRIQGYGLARLLPWLRLTNGAPNLSGKDPLSKMLWLREERPEIWARTRQLADAKDYLVRRATGEATTTADGAHLTWLMDARRGRWNWSPVLLRRAGINDEMLGEIRLGGDIVGTLRAEAAGELGLAPGTAVVGGAGDALASALGAGATEDDALFLYYGTSSWWGAPRAGPKVDVLRNIGTLAGATRDRYLLVATQESAGAAAAWGAELLGFGGDLAAFDAAASAIETTTSSPLFLPWLQGERVPVDDAGLTAGFHGLTLDSGRPQLARAVLEGVALNSRWALDELARSLASPPAAARIVGGGASSDLWCQITADVTGLTLTRPAHPDLAGCRGVAGLSAAALGWPGTTLGVMDGFEPDATRKAIHDARFARFLAATKAATR